MRRDFAAVLGPAPLQKGLKKTDFLGLKAKWWVLVGQRVDIGSHSSGPSHPTEPPALGARA